MKFLINKEKIQNEEIVFLLDDMADEGLSIVADMVSDDFNSVFGCKPTVRKIGVDDRINYKNPVICMTVGNSCILDNMVNEKLLSIDELSGKSESYIFKLVESGDNSGLQSIVIVGTDKRGTIYGMFHLSEILGVSPFVNWLSVVPSKKEEFLIDESYNMVSDTPSVKFRGFFINDEWPAFGTFCNQRFGGFNLDCYKHIFELLLRLKGNYMWPAMWSSIFSDDGPGLASAEYADKIGVIMGMSHHEPCLRHGEEYKYLRGKDSIYGDAWNFRTNRDGIIKFWEDGLKRSGKFENVITVGMRGEADSTILGKNATLKDNIDLLRDVLKTQNELIRREVNTNLEEVPRMLALYKEVEPFFYGDSETKGLMGDPELEGVTLMLCDDNFGNLRTVPTDEMKSHKGGYGMYYHFDYHGWPISFEWVNSTALSKVWEQMTQCYEFGIRDLWIVNVGDLFTMEYPLAYFLDMAYDYDKWGISNVDSAKIYTSMFVDKCFGAYLDDEKKEECSKLLLEYTKLASNRRPEAMNSNVYSACNYNECEELIAKCSDLIARATMFRDNCSTEIQNLFFELVMYPLCANMNVQKMWAACSINHYLVSINAGEAARFADIVDECISYDDNLVDLLHNSNDKKWFGMGLSEHIGFNNWNEEECSYPVIHRTRLTNKNRLVATVKGTNQSTEGGVWTKKSLVLGAFLRPDTLTGEIRLYSTGNEGTQYEVVCDSQLIDVSKMQGFVDSQSHNDILIKINRDKIKEDIIEKITINYEFGSIDILVPIKMFDINSMPDNTYLWCGSFEDISSTVFDYVSIEADGYVENVASGDEKFTRLDNYGKTNCGMKVIGVTNTFESKKGPYLKYNFELPEEGKYIVKLYTSPANPSYMDNKLIVGVDINGEYSELDMIPIGYKVSDDNADWKKGVLDNIRTKDIEISGNKGLNSLKVYAVSPGLVLEKIVVCRANCDVMYGYLGPKETYRSSVNG